MKTTASPRMFRRQYVLAKDTPRLKAGTVVQFDPFRGDYTNEPIALAARGPVERFGFDEVENPEWFTPDSELVPFRPPMIPRGAVSASLAEEGCVVVTVQTRHNDLCDWCRNARVAVDRTEAEVVEVVYRLLQQHYDAGFNENEERS